MRFAFKVVLFVTVVVFFGLVSIPPIQAGFMAQATSYPANETPPGSGYPTQAYPNPTQVVPTAAQVTPTRTLTPPIRSTTPAISGTPAGTLPAGTPNRLLTEQAEMDSAKGTPPATETLRSGTPVLATPTVTGTLIPAVPDNDKYKEGRFFTFRPGFFFVGMIYAILLGSVIWMVYTFVRRRM